MQTTKQALTLTRYTIEFRYNSGYTGEHYCQFDSRPTLAQVRAELRSYGIFADFVRVYEGDLNEIDITAEL